MNALAARAWERYHHASRGTGPGGALNRNCAACPTLVAASLAVLAPSGAAAAAVPMPRTAPAQGRYELLVDGKPYLVLGAHVNSSSDSPAKLPQVSPAVGEMRADTVAMPIAWEQLAPEEGTFDFSFLERQARAHGLRVVRLGFGTAVFVLLSDDSAVHRQTIRRDPVDRV
jgi:hypothetical protein